ncbi:MAG: hypothetical protein EPN98_05225 [Phenylobacterium sp.]|uniref:hypothetical protein n=1 Tax=Phenylobacterium sp. TaxID=1871053 RepID=UPI0011FB64EB|nr:hypothetical protein [Phenylobacterium sp.]TAL36238.1 MAG: hypothetical protein EPN98_05225 [Phenylobacterium sp.]
MKVIDACDHSTGAPPTRPSGRTAKLLTDASAKAWRRGGRGDHDHRRESHGGEHRGYGKPPELFNVLH